MDALLASAFQLSPQDVFAELLSHAQSLENKVVKLEQKVLDQAAQLDWYKRQLWGASSERRVLKAIPVADQLWLGEQMLETPVAPPSPSTTVKAHERAHRKKPTDLVDSESRLRFDSTVPVEEIVVPNPALEGLPEEELKNVSERVTYRLAQRSAYVVLKYVQKIVKHKATSELLCPPIPGAIIERSPADVSFLANMVVDKFQYHLPLYRQHQRLEQSGVFLDRGTLTRLVHRTGEMLEMVYSSLLSSILQSKVLTVDESPTKAGRAKGKMKTGYYWALYGDQEEVAFLFSPTRARKVLDEVLTSFTGTLLSDGYIAYESFVQKTEGVVGAQCWTHTRRNFIDAEKLEPQRSAHVINLMKQLYDVEEIARGKPGEERRRLRNELSRPVVNVLFEFFEHELERTALLPSNPFVQAIEYAVARKTQLMVFLENPDVPIDTNHVERTLRGQAVGRKNWMFHVTEVGARYGAIFYSLIQSCILAGVRPAEYLIDVLQRMDTHPAAEVHLLTPRLWKIHFGAAPLRSDIAVSRKG